MIVHEEPIACVHQAPGRPPMSCGIHPGLNESNATILAVLTTILNHFATIFNRFATIFRDY